MRVVMGWVLLQGVLTKLVTYLDADPANDWAAARHLANAIPEGNPFTGVRGVIAGNPLVDVLVVWGLTLTGIGLVICAFVRWNAFWAALMILTFWVAALQGGLAAGPPIERGWVVDDHVVYGALLFGLGAISAGRLLGVFLLGVAGHLAALATLWLALRSLRVRVPVPDLLVVIPLAKASGISPTPGGAGTATMLLAGLLVALAGVDSATATAAALLYRAAAFGVPTAVGMVVTGPSSDAASRRDGPR